MAPKPSSPKRPLSHFLRLGLFWVLGLIGALFAAEGFLRLLFPVETMFDTWFTPGIEQFDAKYGFAYKPYWSGLMRHSDQLNRGVPLSLDQYGFRLPNTAGAHLPGKPIRVVVIGGRSSVMSYGLPDDQSITAAIALRLSEYFQRPVIVHNTAWAGGNLHRNWNLFRDYLDDQSFDAAVICHINPSLEPFKNPQNYEKITPWGSPETIFKYLDGIYLWPSGLVAKIGKPAFKSYLGYGFIRLIDRAQSLYEEQFQQADSIENQIIQKQSIPPDPRLRQAYFDFFQFVEAHFEKKGTPSFFAFVPRKNFPLDHYDPYTRHMPKNLPFADFHQEFFAQTRDPKNFLANNHYQASLAQPLGYAIADHLIPFIEANQK